MRKYQEAATDGDTIDVSLMSKTYDWP